LKKLLPLLFLFSAPAFSQPFDDYTKITAFSIFDEPDDGPCSVHSYATNPEFSTWVRQFEIVDCKEIILDLLAIQKESAHWKSNEYECRPGSIGGNRVPYMVALQLNKFRDTLYFTDDLRSIFVPGKQRLFNDSEAKVRKALAKNVTLYEFFMTDFTALQRKAFQFEANALDSVALSDVSHKSLYGLSIEQVDKAIGGFDRKLQSVESIRLIDGSWETTIVSSADKDDVEYSFGDGQRIMMFQVYYNEDSFDDSRKASVLGFAAGDDEAKLVKRFPLSAQSFAIRKQYFKDSEGIYDLGINLRDDKGRIYFYLKDGKIIRIQVVFQYH
jgi:hypothetical protein